MSSERQTMNTFTKTPTCAQLLAYVIVISKCIIFTSCVQNSFNDYTKRITIIILYYVSFLSLILFWGITSKCNPSDPYIYEIQSKFGKKSSEPILYCQKCRSFVQQTSLHCKICNRCIIGFDHHCVWINNCIGSSNYKIFIAMIFSALINLALFLVGIAMLWNEGQWNYYLAKMIIAWITGGVVSVFVVLLLGLVSFHVYLIYKGKTTYEFLMEDKIKKIIPQNSHQPIKQQRICEITPEINNSKASAIDYHKNGLIFQLNRSESCSQSKSNSHLEIKKKEEEKQRNESEQSPSQTQGQIALRRNKSFDFLIGRCDVERESRAIENKFKSLHRRDSRLFTEDTGGQKIKKNNLPKLTVMMTFNK